MTTHTVLPPLLPTSREENRDPAKRQEALLTLGRRAMSRPVQLTLMRDAASIVATVLGAAAALEQDLRTAKTAAGLRATARAGFWPGGPAPFGYRLERDPAGSRHKVLVIDEGEAGLLRQVVGLVLDVVPTEVVDGEPACRCPADCGVESVTVVVVEPGG